MEQNKILIIADNDDKSLFDLQESLSVIDGVLSVDIENNIENAINNSKIKEYNPIITDISKNKKSALNLLLNLKKRKYTGNIIVIEENKDDKQIKEIKSLGIVDIVKKPIDINILIKKVEKLVSKHDFVIRFDSINLLSVLQIINVEKKTIRINIEYNGNKGLIYTSEGEIIDAKFSDLTGLKALKKMINFKAIDISLLELRNEVIKRTIDIPFEELIFKIVKSLDEEEAKQVNLKEEWMFENTFDDFESISGFIAGGIYDGTGKILASTSKSKNLNIDDVGVQAIKLYKAAKEVCSSMNIGTTNFIETHTDEYTFIHTCIVPGKGAVGILLKKDGNIGMTRFQMKELVEKVKPQFE